MSRHQYVHTRCSVYGEKESLRIKLPAYINTLILACNNNWATTSYRYE